ncbi:MAG: hypothetical protein PHV06_12595, partial [bacterium]|nr:hypothetical protein [bacterium]
AKSTEFKNKPVHGKHIKAFKGFFDTLFLSYRIYNDFESERTETYYSCAAHMLINTEKLRKIGGFPDNFFLEWEDYYVCRKAKNLFGWSSIYEPSAECRHLVGGAIEKNVLPEKVFEKIKARRTFNYFRNSLISIFLFNKTSVFLGTFLNYSFILPIKSFLKFNFRKLFSLEKATLNFIFNLRNIIKEKKINNMIKKAFVNDEDSVC